MGMYDVETPTTNNCLQETGKTPAVTQQQFEGNDFDKECEPFSLIDLIEEFENQGHLFMIY